VRETLAITAYTTGDYALALRELRTYRRISGRDDQIALMVDSERGLGRPDRALELGRSVDESKLDTNGKVQLAIAMSGARLDQGNAELALAELEIPQLDRTKAFSYSPALFSAYAAVLADLGRDKEAATWERAAEAAEAALEEAQSGFETVEFITEPNPDYIPPEEPEDEDSDAETESAEAEAETDDESLAEPVEAGDEAEAEVEPEVEEAVDPSTRSVDEVSEDGAGLEDDEFTRASVSEQVEAEFAGILAEIDAATEVEAEETVDEVAEVVEAAEVEEAPAEVEEAETEEDAKDKDAEDTAADEKAAQEQPAEKKQADAKAPASDKLFDDDTDDDDEQLSLFDL